MNRYYKGTPSSTKPAAPVDLPVFTPLESNDPSGYLPDSGLADAVNVALILHQPLLLTGEAGTGKTQLAYSVAWELGLDEPLVFETKSTSIAKDLFYSFDNLARFQAVQAGGEPVDPKNFIHFNALGIAIIHANEHAKVKEVLPLSFKHNSQRRSVVLIDEIDKAPRDFPNDILNEIERLYFRVPELSGFVVSADHLFQPVVIMTSNSEKTLPDAFLRRCIFYNVPFPDEERLEQIIFSRVKKIHSHRNKLLNEGLDFFSRLRAEEAGLHKKPGTAELINWMTALIEMGAVPGMSLRSQAALAMKTLSTLNKMIEDQEQVLKTFKSWVHE